MARTDATIGGLGVDSARGETLMPGEQKLLAQYLRYRTAPPTVASIVRRSLRGWAIIVGIFAVAIVVEYAVRLPLVAALLAGVLVGRIVRDLTSYRQFVRQWPLTSRVLDWDKIDRLAARAGMSPDRSSTSN